MLCLIQMKVTELHSGGFALVWRLRDYEKAREGKGAKVSVVLIR